MGPPSPAAGRHCDHKLRLGARSCPCKPCAGPGRRRVSEPVWTLGSRADRQVARDGTGGNGFREGDPDTLGWRDQAGHPQAAPGQLLPRLARRAPPSAERALTAVATGRGPPNSAPLPSSSHHAPNARENSLGGHGREAGQRRASNVTARLIRPGAFGPTRSRRARQLRSSVARGRRDDGGVARRVGHGSQPAQAGVNDRSG
jgi:hypothetical protein